MTFEQFEAELDGLIAQMKEGARQAQLFDQCYLRDVAHIATGVAKLTDFVAHTGLEAKK